MKKRILSLLLACALTVGLLPVLSATSLAAQQSANLYTTCNTGSATPSDSVQFSTAYVRNYNTGAAGNGTAGKLEVVVNLKDVADNSVSIFAMVMRADSYSAALPGGPATSKLSGDNYYSNPTLSASGNVNYYAIARRPYNSTTDKTGLELRMPLVIPNAANSNNMANNVAVNPGIVKSMAVPSVAGTGASANYYVKYKLVVFSMGNTGARDTQYYVDDFYLDADGYVCTPSYALRYNGNNPSTTNAGTGTGKYDVGDLPARVITRASWAAAKATWPPAGGTPAIPGINVTNQKPTRQGFTFVGWSTTAIPYLQPGDDAAAKVTAAGGTFYQGTGSEPFACPGGGAFQVNEIYDLYAVWRIVPIQFDKTKAVEGTATYKDLIAANGAAYTGVTDPNGVTEYRLTLTPEPQVNVYYSSGDQKLTQPVTTVAKTWEGAVQSVAKKNGAITHHGSAITRSNDYGIAVGGTDSNKAWSLSTNTGQGPKAHSDEDEVRFVLKVTEPSNDTYDIITVVFSQIRKGAQPIPTADVNTGLQSQVATLTDEQLAQLTDEQKSALAEGNKDGQIFGFYSAGPKKDTGAEYTPDDTGYRDTVDGNNTGLGNGTMTSYYITNRMIYEYRPVKVGGADVDYTGLPNEGWREMPMPKNWYGAAYITGATRTAFENSLTLNAKDVITTGYAPGTGSHAPVTVITNLSDSFKANGWPDSYGWIEWADDTATALPVLHGLKADDVYEIRFRQNTKFSASDPKTVTIGGAAASSSGGSSAGLLFNLMRGSVWQIPKPQEQEPQAVTTISVTMGAGGTATITNVKEAEATADDGDETEPTEPVSVTINANETKALTVLGQPVTVTVTPADGFETHTVTVTADEAPLTPTDGTYTLPAKTVTGALALNISFTAPDTPPAPETHSAVTVETDVTDTLFAASPTGTLPDGSTLGLGEGETLQLRDPDGALVDSITFYVSATGSVLSPGAIDIYTCTLNDSKTGMVWTKNGDPDPVTVTNIDLGGSFLSLAAQFGGKANPNDFASIVFYDWDETTVLGSIVVAKGADATEDVNKFVRALQSPESKDVDDSKEKHWVDDLAYPMTYKNGYSFLSWIPFESEEVTAYGERVISNNANNLGSEGENVAKAASKLIAPKVTADFSNVTDNLIVKAAYTTNEECVTGPYAAQRQYTVTPVDYGRFGTTFNFTITLRVERGAVPRPTEPYLRVKMTVGGTTMISLYKLSGADVEDIQIIPYTTLTGGVTQIAWAVVDAYGLSDMNGAAARSAEAATSIRPGVVQSMSFDGGNYNVVKDGERTYMHKAYLAGINTALTNYDPNTAITTMTDITPVVLRTVGIPLGGMNINNAKTALYEKWKSINMTDGVVNKTIIPLTRDDMLDALGTKAQAPDIS